MRAHSEPPSSEINIPLTGRFTFRRSITGKLLLRVEENVRTIWPWARSEYRRRWRDARLMDLAAPELRMMMDLRAQTQFITPRYFPAAELTAVAETVEEARLNDSPTPRLSMA